MASGDPSILAVGVDRETSRRWILFDCVIFSGTMTDRGLFRLLPRLWKGYCCHDPFGVESARGIPRQRSSFVASRVLQLLHIAEYHIDHDSEQMHN